MVLQVSRQALSAGKVSDDSLLSAGTETTVETKNILLHVLQFTLPSARNKERSECYAYIDNFLPNWKWQKELNMNRVFVYTISRHAEETEPLNHPIPLHTFARWWNCSTIHQPEENRTSSSIFGHIYPAHEARNNGTGNRSHSTPG